MLFIFLLLVSACSNEGNKMSSLEDDFINPPHDAKPRTWMHAMSGNMSKEGLTKDLESMSEVGIGGLLLFNITQGIPNGPIIYNSPEHHEMIKHAAKEAERLGLSFGVHNCDGWSSSGGPWVSPEESMKMIVWSETVVDGGNVNTLLEEPSKREGLYQDIAVIAYPSLASEVDDANNQAILTSSDSDLDISLISDGKIDAQSRLKKIGDKDPWIQFQYNAPKTLRSSKIIFNDRHATATLQVSVDGKDFSDVRELFKVRTGKGEWAINDHFEGVTSRYFRLKFNQNTTIKEALLSSSYFINNPLARTLIARTEDEKLAPIGSPGNKMIIDNSDIKILSESMDESGVLSTVLPEGKWSVMRFGYTSTGAFNNPASDEGRGLEVDKLSRPAFKNFFDGFVKKVIDNTKSIAPNALQYIEIDSYEMGGQNWTDNLDSIFISEKGYDIIKFLPLVAGRFVESVNASEAVLSDFRDVITHLMTDNYFAYFTELCNEAGLKSYIEPYGFGPLNDLDIGGKTDLPMGEFWMNRPITQTASPVSSAHIYGKPVISAESFTSRPEINWKGNPALAKTSGDLAWTYGINEFMFHRFAHQANVHAEPGMTMNRWGFHFDRTQTWWKNAGADWFKYIARGSYLLRQGNPVSDLLVYIGEGTPNGSYHRSELKPDLPKTINFDNVNTDVLVNRLKIKSNELVLPEGTSYRILLLKNSKIISLETAVRIHEIASRGVPVYGDVPEGLLGYNHSDDSKAEFAKIISELSNIIKPVDDWDEIMSGLSIIPDLSVNNDDTLDYVHRKTAEEDIYFFFNNDTAGAKIYDISFRVGNKIPELWYPMSGDIVKKADYVVEEEVTRTDIRLNAGESVFVVFREEASDLQSVIKSDPRIGYSYTDPGKIEAQISENGNYTIPISTGKTQQIKVTDLPDPIGINGKWNVKFNQKSGYGSTVEFPELIDWKDHQEDSIKYYSGTAAYNKSFTVPIEYKKDDYGAILELASVFIVAEVIINDKPAGVTWMPPYKLDISDYLIPGKNTLEIRVTNQWSNRLIGDERYPPNDGGYKLGPHRATDLTMPEWYVKNEPRPSGKRTTFTTAPFYKKDSPLMPSGLMGPVEIRFYKKLNIIVQ
ncbi:MAG: glycoside hydrolase [Saprospiraceae bacterium]|nr:glycoside hydrolase [Saprospiraceae bacterium]